MKFSILYLSVFILLLLSCKRDDLTQSLRKAGDNRICLEELLAEYKNSEADSLKYNALCFLLENMIDKYYLSGCRLDEYNSFIDSIYRIQADMYHEKNYYSYFMDNSVYQSQPLDTLYDLQQIDADFLRDVIEESFLLWKKPWARQLNFEEFCELILPYRVGNELPEKWRPIYKYKFGDALNDTIKNAIDACTAVNDKLIQYPIHLVHTSVKPSDMRASSLINMKFGMCEDYAQLAIYAMRAVGIPTAIETIPAFGKGRSKHTFNVVFNNDRKYYNFSGGEQNPADKHLQRFPGIPKVYRYTFGRQKQSLALLAGDEKIPPFFRNPCLLDVTSNYDFILPCDVELDLGGFESKNRFLYLSVFGVSGWRPVAWCEKKKDNAFFENMGSDIIYQLTYYTGKSMKPIGYPFLLKGKNNMQSFVPDTVNTITLCLDRKYPPAKHLANIPEQILGAKIQASNRADFVQSVDVYTFDTIPSFKYTTIETHLDKPYRFYRFLSPDSSHLNMAELEFYKDDGSLLQGKVISDTDISSYYPDATGDKLFDQDPLTFTYSMQTGCFVGIDIQYPTVVNKIRYIIRNDDNGIRAQQEYELFYADKDGWKSFKRMKADKDDMIVFENVPSRALYWLHNHTKGQEERIFLYKNGLVEWW